MKSQWESNEFEDSAFGTVFRDVLMLALIGFVAMVIMMLPHLSKSASEAEEQDAPGSVVVEIHWPGELPVDVDLWVRAPNDIPVGYYNQNSLQFNLLRDDLGIEGDTSGKNYEIAYSRGITAGEYIVNVHQFGRLPPDLSVPVQVIVSVRQRYDSLRPVLTSEVTLYRYNQEETAFRFNLTERGEVIEGSVSTLRQPLITQQ